MILFQLDCTKLTCIEHIQLNISFDCWNFFISCNMNNENCLGYGYCCWDMKRYLVLKFNLSRSSIYCQLFLLNKGFLSWLVSSFQKNLDDSGHLVRCECLCLIGSLATSEMNIHEETQEASTSLVLSVQDLLSMYTTDQDPRVRTAAFQAMVSGTMFSWVCCLSYSLKVTQSCGSNYQINYYILIPCTTRRKIMPTQKCTVSSLNVTFCSFSCFC